LKLRAVVSTTTQRTMAELGHYDEALARHQQSIAASSAVLARVSAGQAERAASLQALRIQAKVESDAARVQGAQIAMLLELSNV
jgi:hypothetical protein